jgi:hypothetical protein
LLFPLDFLRAFFLLFSDVGGTRRFRLRGRRWVRDVTRGECST